MGIDTTIKYQELKLKEEWIDKEGDKFLDAWKKECENNNDLAQYWDDIDYKIGGEILLEEPRCKRYDHNEFGEAIKKYLLYGFIELETEGELWAMEWNDFGYKEMDATVLWDPDYLELFLKHYGDKLTNKVIEEIKLCIGADKI